MGGTSSPLVLLVGANEELGKELDDEKQGDSFTFPSVSDGARL